MTFTLDVREQDATTVVAVTGDVDIHTSPQLQDVLDEVASHRPDGGVVIDLTGCDFVDSSALGVMVGAGKQLGDGRSGLRVVCANPLLLRVFTITRLNEVIPIFDSLAAATAP